jgi:hypothetical protein
MVFRKSRFLNSNLIFQKPNENAILNSIRFNYLFRNYVYLFFTGFSEDSFFNFVIYRTDYQRIKLHLDILILLMTNQFFCSFSYFSSNN